MKLSQKLYSLFHYILSLYLSEIINGTEAFSAIVEIPIVRTVKKAAVVAIEMSTRREGNLDPPKCESVAPLGAVRVGAAQRVPVQNGVSHSRRKLRK